MYKGAKLSCNRYLGCKWDKSIINKRVRNLHEAKPSGVCNRTSYHREFI
jgi:hypothetical protein